jgi:preprotein translocase subunit SecD
VRKTELWLGVLGLLVVLVLVVLVWRLWRIDIRDGTELVYQGDLGRVARDRGLHIEKARQIITRRLRTLGVRGIVSVEGEDRIVVRVRDKDPGGLERIRAVVERTGDLSLRLVVTPQDPAQLAASEKEERDHVDADRAWVENKLADPGFRERRPEPPPLIVRTERARPGEAVSKSDSPAERKHLLENRHAFDAESGEWKPAGFVTGRYLSSAFRTLDPDTFRPCVSFEFEGEGAAALADITGSNFGRQLAIVLDDSVVQVATIRGRITSSGQLTGDFTDDDVERIVTVLRGGSLPVPLKLLSQQAIRP